MATHIFTAPSNGMLYYSDLSSTVFPGDTILLRGTFSSIYMKNVNGNASNPVSIVVESNIVVPGNGNYGVIITGSYWDLFANGNLNIIGSSLLNQSFGFEGSSYIHIDGVNIEYSKVGFFGNSLSAPVAGNRYNISITNCTINDIQSGLAPGLGTCEGIYIGNTTPTSLTQSWNNVYIENVHIDGADGDGIQVALAQGTTIRNCTVNNFARKNIPSQKFGILLGGCSQGIIENCSVTNGLGGALHIYGVNKSYVINCTFSNCATGTASDDAVYLEKKCSGETASLSVEFQNVVIDGANRNGIRNINATEVKLIGVTISNTLSSATNGSNFVYATASETTTTTTTTSTTTTTTTLAPIVNINRTPNFILPQFAFSNDGGVRNAGNTDIEQYQEFTLDSSKWRCIQFHNLKFSYTNGNLLKVIGATNSFSYVDIADGIVSEIDAGITYSVSIVNDVQGKKRIIRNDGSKSWYVGANQYWFGTGLGYQDSAFRGIRLQYLKVNNGGVTYSMYQPNQSAAQYVYGGALGSNPTILNGTDMFLFEQIPYIGATISIDGSKNKKISDTEYEIYEWGLMGATTYPSIDTNTISLVVPEGDKLTYLGTTYSIIERKRCSSSGAVVGTASPGWVIKLNTGITHSNPLFTVVDSKTEFMLTGTHSMVASFYTFNGYFCYASSNGNYIFENAHCNGYGRYTDNPKNANGSEHTYSLSSPLYLLQKYLSFKNYNHVGEIMQTEMTGASGLEWRNRITGTDSNRLIIDGGRLWWLRGSTTSNVIEFRNRPTLMVGGSFGETRILDPITDGTGFVIEDGASFNFSNRYPQYDLSNIELRYTGYGGLNRNYNIRLIGQGNVDISNFTSDIISAPDTYMGIDYASYFSGADWKLNLTGSGGRCGFRVGGTFSNNSIILSNWNVVKIPYTSNGYSRYNTTWPASYTEVYPNFIIATGSITTTSTTTTTTTAAPELWTINWLTGITRTYDESTAYGILTLFTNGVPTEQYSTLDVGSGNFYLYSNNTYQFKFELIDAASGPGGDPGFFYDLNELSGSDIIDVAYGNYPGLTQATINLTFPETINPFASYNLDIYGQG